MKLVIIYAISAALAVGAVVLTSWLADAIKRMFGED
jgi:hypothetical protein